MATRLERPGSRGFLGPVAELESHLPQEWWRELFDSIYLQTDGDVVENVENTVTEVDTLIRCAGLTAADRVFDLCCGQGRHVLELARRGFTHVGGVDRSRYLIRLARRRAERAGLKVTFHEGDARRFRRRQGQVDCVTIMGNSFGYFASEEDDKEVLKSVIAMLRSGGRLYLDITDGEWMQQHFEPRSWEWIDQNQFVCRERSLTRDGTRLVSREVLVHAERGVIADQFYAERLYPQAKLVGLLEEMGFHAIRVEPFDGTQSTRGQDLGMLARRLVVTAVGPRKDIAAGKGSKPAVKVAVLLGDPRLPDPIKRDGAFNPEDFDAIERLKDALADLPGYTFRYLDNHPTFEADLRSDAPDLVFNLCDEGFNNDAFMELHIPALLEMMGLPYTGGGPACLAVCYDKALVRAQAQLLEIPVPLETYVKVGDQSATLPSAFPALLKPNFGDSSIGITTAAVVNRPEELIRHLEDIRENWRGRPVLIQEFLTGREFSVALVGNPEQGLEALPVLEVDYSGLDAGLPHILGYESKWLPDSPYWTQIRYVRADLPAKLYREMIEWCCALFERLDCHDYARFDFREDAAGTIKLLEVNPNPGWVWDGKFNLMGGMADKSYSELLGNVLEAAVERYAERLSKGKGPAEGSGATGGGEDTAH